MGTQLHSSYSPNIGCFPESGDPLHQGLVTTLAGGHTLGRRLHLLPMVGSHQIAILLYPKALTLRKREAMGASGEGDMMETDARHQKSG